MLRAQLFLCLHFSFVLYWRKPTGAKAAREMLVKLTPDQRCPTHSPLATCGEWFCFLIFQKCNVLSKMYKMLRQNLAFSILINSFLKKT
jgi:hypothetical protein